MLTVSPAEVGKRIGLPDALSAARAVRALRARKRLEKSEDGSFRLLDARPLEPGEPEAIPRQPRQRKAKAKDGATRERSSEPGRLTYGEVGRAAIDRLVDLGREAGTLRGNLRTLREEAREAREAKDEAERRASALAGRVKDLEGKLEMAESNLRTILSAAKGTAAHRDGRRRRDGCDPVGPEGRRRRARGLTAASSPHARARVCGAEARGIRHASARVSPVGSGLDEAARGPMTHEGEVTTR